MFLGRCCPFDLALCVVKTAGRFNPPSPPLSQHSPYRTSQACPSRSLPSSHHLRLPHPPSTLLPAHDLIRPSCAPQPYSSPSSFHTPGTTPSPPSIRAYHPLNQRVASSGERKKTWLVHTVFWSVVRQILLLTLRGIGMS